MRTSSDRADPNLGLAPVVSDRIPPYERVLAKKTRSPQVGGGAYPPPNIPGKLTPLPDPCPSRCEGGVHCCHGREKAHFSAAAGLPARTFSRFGQKYHRFGQKYHSFGQFWAVSTVTHVLAVSVSRLDDVGKTRPG